MLGLGSDRRGGQPGAAGSQVFYANAPVVIAQNTVLSGVRTITLAPTGPGVSGAAGTTSPVVLHFRSQASCPIPRGRDRTEDLASPISRETQMANPAVSR